MRETDGEVCGKHYCAAAASIKTAEACASSPAVERSLGAEPTSAGATNGSLAGAAARERSVPPLARSVISPMSRAGGYLVALGAVCVFATAALSWQVIAATAATAAAVRASHVTVFVADPGGAAPTIEARHASTRDIYAHCNPLQVQRTLATAALSPSQKVACLAIAGDISSARGALMRSHERASALQEIFAVAHPIADAGDDRAAGPIMKLVVEFWPENYMAVFHAGMADYALGQDASAREYLLQFMNIYHAHDIWRSRAAIALAGIEQALPLSERQAHFAE